MKKYFLLVITAFLLAAPALILYSSMQTSTTLINLELEKQLIKTMQYELQGQDQVINPIIEKFQNLFLFLRKVTAKAEAMNLQNLVNDEYLAFLINGIRNQAKSVWFPAEASLVFQKDGKDQYLSLKNGSENPGLFIEELTRQLRNLQGFYNSGTFNKAPLAEFTSMAIKNLGLFFSFSILKPDGDGTRSQRIVVREKERLRLFVLQRLQNSFLLNFMFDFTSATPDLLVRRKVSNWQNKEMGLMFISNQKPNRHIASEFFVDKTSLKDLIKRRIHESAGKSLWFKNENFIVLTNQADPKKSHRVILAARSPETMKQPKMLFLVSIMAIFGCFLFKLVCEKIILGRSIKISLRVFIVGTFVLVSMLPLLSSAYLANEYIVANFKISRNQVAEELSNELQSLDLESYATFRRSINQAKNLNSVEKLADFTGLPVSAPIKELTRATVNKLREVNGKILVSEVWVYEEGQPYFSMKYASDKKIYELVFSNNVLLTEIFLPRFREYLRRSRQLSDQQKTIETKNEIEFDAVKSEIFNNFILDMFGDKTYYKVRENFGYLIKFESMLENNAFISIPVSVEGGYKYIFTWVFAAAEFRESFPVERLRIDEEKPVFSIFGNEQYTGAKPGSILELTEKFPDLMRLGRKAHLTSSRLLLQDHSASGSPILEAAPARYSDYIICGRRFTRDLTEINAELAGKALRIFLIIAISGLAMALLTSLYFTLPIRKLIGATEEIINGNYKVRLNSNHPDEFATAAKAFNKMATGLEEGRLLSNFVSDSVKELAELDHLSTANTAKSCEVTVLFSSIKGFNELQKELEPEKVFAVLQAHLSASVAAVKLYGGEIDKMIEDKVMIVFEQDSHSSQEIAEAAVKVALSIKNNLKAGFGLTTAAGLNSGEAISGVMGAANARLSKTVVGDTVNLAARLAGVSANLPDGGVVVSGKMIRLIDQEFACEKLSISKVKGKTHAVEAYLVKC